MFPPNTGRGGDHQLVANRCPAHFHPSFYFCVLAKGRKSYVPRQNNKPKNSFKYSMCVCVDFFTPFFVNVFILLLKCCCRQLVLIFLKILQCTCNRCKKTINNAQSFNRERGFCLSKKYVPKNTAIFHRFSFVLPIVCFK